MSRSRPTREYRIMQWIAGPPCGEMLIVSEKEAEVPHVRIFFPELFLETKTHADDRPHAEQAKRIFLCLEWRREFHASCLQHSQRQCDHRLRSPVFTLRGHNQNFALLPPDG